MLKDKLAKVLAHGAFERTILALIVLNAITLGLETSPWAMARFGVVLVVLDRIILGVFVVEIAIRMFVDFRGFWRDPWRIFDFTIVAIALVPATGSLSVLRAFRILRVLRLISTVPAMRRVVSGLLSALPGMGSIVFLLALIFYVFAVISTKMFAADFPQWFGSIGESSYTLFQIMTLESWSMGVVRPVMQTYVRALHHRHGVHGVEPFHRRHRRRHAVRARSRSPRRACCHDERNGADPDRGAGAEGRGGGVEQGGGAVRGGCIGGL